jgi:hypothetical protein
MREKKLSNRFVQCEEMNIIDHTHTSGRLCTLKGKNRLHFSREITSRRLFLFHFVIIFLRCDKKLKSLWKILRSNL